MGERGVKKSENVTMSYIGWSIEILLINIIVHKSRDKLSGKNKV